MLQELVYELLLLYYMSSCWLSSLQHCYHICHSIQRSSAPDSIMRLPSTQRKFFSSMKPFMSNNYIVQSWCNGHLRQRLPLHSSDVSSRGKSCPDFWDKCILCLVSLEENLYGFRVNTQARFIPCSFWLSNAHCWKKFALTCLIKVVLASYWWTQAHTICLSRF